MGVLPGLVAELQFELVQVLLALVLLPLVEEVRHQGDQGSDDAHHYAPLRQGQAGHHRGGRPCVAHPIHNLVADCHRAPHPDKENPAQGGACDGARLWCRGGRVPDY